MYTPVLDKISSTNQSRGRDRANDAIERGIRQIRLQNRYSPSVSPGSGNSSASEERRREDKDRGVHETAERMILESEKFKANATKPPEGNHIDMVPLENYNYDDDANFLTSTCHVESGLSDKASRGKYVELDKLLNKRSKDTRPESEQKMQLLNKDGLCVNG